MYILIDLVTNEHLEVADINWKEAQYRNKMLDAQNAPRQWFHIELIDEDQEEDVILKWVAGSSPQRIRYHEFYD